ncbi:MAG: hypothetical protein ACJA2Q_001921 [Pseudohongiellaceae bacterium]|jgi:hypothetical protein
MSHIGVSLIGSYCPSMTGKLKKEKGPDQNFCIFTLTPFLVPFLFSLPFEFFNLFSLFSVNNLSTASSYLIWEIMRLH